MLFGNIRIAGRVILSDSRASRANPFHLGQTFSLFHEKLRPRCVIGPVHHAALQTREKRAIGGARFTGFASVRVRGSTDRKDILEKWVTLKSRESRVYCL